jgi:SMI1/KNR4 family protein SUKH-1
MIDSDFLIEFKRVTELNWKSCAIDPQIYGFQFQAGTKWNPGLSENSIEAYESDLCISFPHDFKAFLRTMNGTDLPTLNIYGSSGELPQESAGVYSYPRDLEIVQQRIVAIHENRNEIRKILAEQGLPLPVDSALVPIFSHRYVMCESNLHRSVVLSIHGTDAIVYGKSLQEYLEKEFLDDAKPVKRPST